MMFYNVLRGESIYVIYNIRFYYFINNAENKNDKQW